MSSIEPQAKPTQPAKPRLPVALSEFPAAHENQERVGDLERPQ